MTNALTLSPRKATTMTDTAIYRPTVYTVRGFCTRSGRTYRWVYVAGAGMARAMRDVRRWQAINAKAGRAIWKDITVTVTRDDKLVSTSTY